MGHIEALRLTKNDNTVPYFKELDKLACISTYRRQKWLPGRPCEAEMGEVAQQDRILLGSISKRDRRCHGVEHGSAATSKYYTFRAWATETQYHEVEKYIVDKMWIWLMWLLIFVIFPQNACKMPCKEFARYS